MKKKKEKKKKNMEHINDFNNTNTIFQLTTEKMEDVQKNQISNIMYQYGIENNAENFNKLAMVINQKEYYIYKEIFTLLENCRIVTENSYSITIEICSEEYRHLLEDISKKCFIKIIKRSIVSFDTNLFFTNIIYK